MENTLKERGNGETRKKVLSKSYLALALGTSFAVPWLPADNVVFAASTPTSHSYLAATASSQATLSPANIAINGAIGNSPFGILNTVDPSTRKKIAFMPVWYALYLLQPYGVTYRWKAASDSLYIQTPASDVKSPSPSTITQRPGYLKVYLNGKLVGTMMKMIKIDPVSNQATLFVPVWYMDEILPKFNVTGSWNATKRIWNLSWGQPSSAAKSGSVSWVSVPGTVDQNTSFVVALNPIGVDGLPLGPGHTVLVTSNTGQKVKAVWNPSAKAYEATFTAGSQADMSFTATVDGRVLPGEGITHIVPDSTSVSVSSSLSSIQATGGANNAVTVIVIPRDANGNALGAGYTVTVSDSNGLEQSAVWNATNQDYETTFNESKSTGTTVTFHAIVNGTALTQQATIGATPTVSASLSTITVPATVESGTKTVIVHVVPKSANSSVVYGGYQVVVKDNYGNSVVATWDASSQSYVATFSEQVGGMVVFSATVNGVALDATASTTVSTAASGPPFDANQSTIQAANTPGSDTVTVSVNPVDWGGGSLGPNQTVVVTDSNGQSETATWDPTTKTYVATFTVTTPGSLTYAATVDGVPLTNGTSSNHPQTSSVTVDPVDGSKSTIDATSTTGSGTVTVSVNPVDANGNSLGAGQTVVVTDSNGQSETATWNSTTEQYVATFPVTTPGSVTYTSTVNGIPLTDGTSSNHPQASSITVDPVDGSKSTIDATSTTGSDTVTVSVNPVDANGNSLGAGQTVVVTDSNGQSKTATWDAATGQYVATFTETTPGSLNFTSTVNGSTITEPNSSNPVTKTITVDPVDTSENPTGQVTADAPALGADTVTVHVVPKDADGKLMTDLDNVTVSDNNNQTQTATWDATSQSYVATFTEPSGTWTYTAKVADVALSQQPTATVTLADASKSTVTADTPALGADTVTVTVVPKESDGTVMTGLNNVTVSDNNNQTQTATWDAASQSYVATFTESSGTWTYTATVGDTILSQQPTATVTLADTSKSTVTANAPASGTDTVTVTVVPKDSSGNVMTGLDNVTVSDNNNQTQTATWSAASQTYVATFTETSGTWTYTATVGDTTLSQQPTATVDLTSLVDLGKSTVTSSPASYATAGPNNVTVTVVPEDSSGNPLGAGMTIKVTDGTSTETASWNSTVQAYQAIFSELNTGYVSFVASLGSKTFADTPTIQISPNNVDNPVKGAIPAGQTGVFTGTVSAEPNEALQIPSYPDASTDPDGSNDPAFAATYTTTTGGKSTTTPIALPSGNGESSDDTYVGFYYLSSFPITSLTSFPDTAVAANGGQTTGAIWTMDNNTSHSGPHDGGPYTDNGTVFFTRSFYLPEQETVTFSTTTIDDVSLTWVDGAIVNGSAYPGGYPVVYANDISSYVSGWGKLGITMPPSGGGSDGLYDKMPISNTVTLSKGTHTVVIEAANAFTPASDNYAAVGLTVKDSNGNTIIDTSDPSQWASSGYQIQLPVFWYNTTGNYIIDEELLDPDNLTVVNSAQWTVNVGNPPASANVTPPTINLAPGASQTVTYQFVDVDGNPVSDGTAGITFDGASSNLWITALNGQTLQGDTGGNGTQPMPIPLFDDPSVTYSVTMPNVVDWNAGSNNITVYPDSNGNVTITFQAGGLNYWDGSTSQAVYAPAATSTSTYTYVYTYNTVYGPNNTGYQVYLGSGAPSTSWNQSGSMTW